MVHIVSMTSFDGEQNVIMTSLHNHHIYMYEFREHNSVWA